MAGVNMELKWACGVCHQLEAILWATEKEVKCVRCATMSLCNQEFWGYLLACYTPEGKPGVLHAEGQLEYILQHGTFLRSSVQADSRVPYLEVQGWWSCYAELYEVGPSAGAIICDQEGTSRFCLTWDENPFRSQGSFRIHGEGTKKCQEFDSQVPVAQGTFQKDYEKSTS